MSDKLLSAAYLDYRKVNCTAEGCDSVSVPQMGHRLCASHCKCFVADGDSYTYDPWLCDQCIEYFKVYFAGNDSEESVRLATKGLDSHIKKFRRYLVTLGEKASLKFTPFMIKLNSKIHSKRFDSSYFGSLVIPDHMNPADDTSSVLSASGSAVSVPVSEGRSTDKPKGVESDVAALNP